MKEMDELPEIREGFSMNMRLTDEEQRALNRFWFGKDGPVSHEDFQKIVWEKTSAIVSGALFHYRVLGTTPTGIEG